MLRRVGLAVLRRLWGVKLVDQRTGAVIGRVVVVRWKGGLRLIGLNGVAVQPQFLPQATESYWAQDLGFSTHPPLPVTGGSCGWKTRVLSPWVD